MKKIQLLSFILLASLLIACEEEETPQPEPPTTSKVLIGNTGAATAGTGSISAYRPVDKSVENNLYQKANITTLGNGLSNVFIDGDLTFLLLGGDGQIVVVESDSYKLIRRIQGFGSPQNMIKVDDDKYYVTDALDGAVKVYSYERNKILETIFTGSYPTAMLHYRDMVFVANRGDQGIISNDLTVIHSVEDTLMSQLKVGDNPNSMQLDSSKTLWVLSSGYEDQDPSLSTPGILMGFDLDMDSLVYQIDSIETVDSLVFVDVNDKPQGLTINSDSTSFYYLDQNFDANLKLHNIGSPVISTANFLEGEFYRMAFDRTNTEIYLSLPKDFTTTGEVLRVDQNGVEKDRFRAGLIPVAFAFK